MDNKDTKLNERNHQNKQKKHQDRQKDTKLNKKQEHQNIPNWNRPPGRERRGKKQKNTTTSQRFDLSCRPYCLERGRKVLRFVGAKREADPAWEVTNFGSWFDSVYTVGWFSDSSWYAFDVFVFFCSLFLFFLLFFVHQFWVFGSLLFVFTEVFRGNGLKHIYITRSCLVWRSLESSWYCCSVFPGAFFCMPPFSLAFIKGSWVRKLPSCGE